MNKALVILVNILGFTSLIAQTDINDARTNFTLGQTVTIKGVAADGGELGPIRYIQDATGGIPIYGPSDVNGIDRGDSVEVTGELIDFSGLLEIDNITNVTNFGPGTEIPAWEVTIPDLGETFEGRLLQINDITFPDAGDVFEAETNYDFTDGTNTGQMRVDQSSGLVGVTIPSGPQTIVGLGGQFNTNYQVLPRDENDVFPYEAPDKKIVIEIDGENFLNGNTAFIGTAASTPITIKNIGINNLTISGTTINGSESADFSTDITAGAIGGSAEENYTLTFTAGGDGSRQATLEINSDDPDNPTFVINIYAIGTDELASEPSEGATNLSFNNVKAYTMSVSFDPSASAEKHLVVWKKGSAPTGVPADGEEYMRGDVIGDGKVAFVGTGASFTPRGIRANTDYYFAIYAYNGYGAYTNYDQVDVLEGNQSSTGNQIGNYYNGIDKEAPTFLDDLTALINPHDVSSYFLYKTVVMNQFEVQDTTNGESFVECAYTGERKVFSGLFDWTATGYSREHTYAHSWMPTFPANSGQVDEPEYSDYHNLYPTNLAEANSPRSNLPFGIITGDVVFTYLDGRVGEIEDGTYVYEPRESQKGNLARAIFYMATAYNGVNGTGDNWKLPSNQDQNLLKDWHFGDLPDNYEIARHELIYDTQNNRNPFIDSVDFVCYVDFSEIGYSDGTACGLSTSNYNIENDVVLFPNPAENEVHVQVNNTEIQHLVITDMSGRIVAQYANKMAININVSDLNTGAYLVNIETAKGNARRKLIVH